MIDVDQYKISISVCFHCRSSTMKQTAVFLKQLFFYSFHVRTQEELYNSWCIQRSLATYHHRHGNTPVGAPGTPLKKKYSVSVQVRQSCQMLNFIFFVSLKVTVRNPCHGEQWKMMWWLEIGQHLPCRNFPVGDD